MQVDDEEAAEKAATGAPEPGQTPRAHGASEAERSGARETAPGRRGFSLGKGLGAGLICLALVAFALGFARFRTSGRVLSSVSMAGVPLGGANRAAVSERLAEREKALRLARLGVRVGAASAELQVAKLGFEFQLTPSRERALGVGRSGGTFADVVRFARSFWASEELAALGRLDDVALARELERIESEAIRDRPFAGGVSVEGGAARALPPRSGRQIVFDGARRALLDALLAGRVAEPIELPTEERAPSLAEGELERGLETARNLLRGPLVLSSETAELPFTPEDIAQLLRSEVSGSSLRVALDVERLEAWLAPRRSRYEERPRDASFEVNEKNEVHVVPAASGTVLTAADVQRAVGLAAARPERRERLPLSQGAPPARSTEAAEALGIRGLLISFTTRHVCCQPRVGNIHRIATLLDGWVIAPGETASVNAAVGPRSTKNGFVSAPSIEDGEMVDTVGGGVSQFATTLFNALFRGGLDIVERKPHSYWFTRYPMGIEATLSWPKPDIVFKNDSAAGLLIKTRFTETDVTVQLFGDLGGRQVRWHVSERRELVQPTVELLPNRSLLPDEEKVQDGGMMGWSVVVSRTVSFADGTKKEEQRKVTYKPKARRVEVHPCMLPKGDPSYTDERCPEPELSPEEGVAKPGPGVTDPSGMGTP